MRNIVGLALISLLFVVGSSARAQQPGKVYRLGFLSIRSEPGPLDEAFKQSLRERGYTEGKNYSVAYRWAEGKFDRFPALAAELVQLKVDVLVTETTPAAQAAKTATQTIPIVMASTGDAVGAGLVETLSHPGGNITGSTFIGTDLAPKWVELAKDILPRATRLAFMAISSISAEVVFFKTMQPAAEQLGMTIRFVDAESPKDFPSAFRKMKQERTDGVIVISNAAYRENRKVIVELAAKHRLPALYTSRDFVEAGGLLSYGVNFTEMFHRAAYYVDRIFKGAKPADLPVERPAKFELLVNLQAAKGIGLTIPPNVLARADKVIK